MNATIDTKTELDVIFPEGKTIRIPKPDGSFEDLFILPLPFRKWKQGFKYIAQIAPLLGFNLFGGSMSPDEIQAASGEELWQKAENAINDIADDPNKLLDIAVADEKADDDLTQRVMQALMGEGAELIYEFLAFAINKPVEYFDTIYEQAVDITLAVIELNLNFFVQKLLPKILNGSKSLVVTAKTTVGNIKQVMANR